MPGIFNPVCINVIDVRVKFIWSLLVVISVIVWVASSYQQRNITNQCTRIATLRFYNGYAPADKWVIVATIARP